MVVVVREKKETCREWKVYIKKTRVGRFQDLSENARGKNKYLEVSVYMLGKVSHPTGQRQDGGKKWSGNEKKLEST